MAIPAASDDISVTHNRPEHRFETRVDGQLSVCEYRINGRQMEFTHTFVPSELRGRGIAEKLVRAALGTARDEGYAVVPSCSYVDAFIRRHVEYQPLLDRPLS
jgi:predicted GNAT family acetyltransferase